MNIFFLSILFFKNNNILKKKLNFFNLFIITIIHSIMCSKNTQCIFVADGLVVINIEENIQSLLLKYLMNIMTNNLSIMKVSHLQHFKLKMEEDWCFSNYPIDQVPLMKSKTGNEKLQRLEIKNKVFMFRYFQMKNLNMNIQYHFINIRLLMKRTRFSSSY